MSLTQKLVQKKARLLRNFYLDLAKGVLVGSILGYLETGLRSSTNMIVGGGLAFFFLNFALYLMRKE